jgi:hypothetical protein
MTIMGPVNKCEGEVCVSVCVCVWGGGVFLSGMSVRASAALSSGIAAARAS